MTKQTAQENEATPQVPSAAPLRKRLRIPNDTVRRLLRDELQSVFAGRMEPQGQPPRTSTTSWR